MLQTVVTARHISVQGEYVKTMDSGRVMVRVGQTYYVGQPVEAVEPAPDASRITGGA
jgi:hypothetical protein